MINLFRRHRTPIICSIIASMVFLYCLDPILSWLGMLFLRVAEFISSAYLDRIYAEASHLETQNYSFYVVVLIILIFMAFSSTFIRIGFMRITSRSNSKKEKIDNDVSAKDESRNIHNKKSLEIDPNQSILRKRFNGIVLLCFGLFSLTWGSAVIGANYIELILISDFSRHIRILRPYIDDATEEKIISEWCLMSSKNDFTVIKKKIEGIAQDNGIELPENKIYSVLSF